MRTRDSKLFKRFAYHNGDSDNAMNFAPELFHWHLINEMSLSELAVQLSRQAQWELDLPAENRNSLPGLRAALSAIAGMSTINE